MKTETLIITKKELMRLAKIFEDIKDDEKILILMEKQENTIDWHLQKNQL